MYRDSGTQTVKIANGDTTSDWVNFRQFTMGTFKTPAALTGTAFSIEVAEEASANTPGSPTGLTDETPAVVGPITVTTGEMYVLPAVLANVHYFRFVSNSAEGGIRSIVVSKKG